MIPSSLVLKPSRLARNYLLGLHLAAAGIACLLPLPWALAGSSVVILHFLWLQRRQPGVQLLQVLPEQNIALFLASGERFEAECLPSSRIFSWLIVLHLRHASGRIDLLLWPDSAPEEILRQWRVWLRWHLPAHRRRQEKTDFSSF